MPYFALFTHIWNGAVVFRSKRRYAIPNGFHVLHEYCFASHSVLVQSVCYFCYSIGMQVACLWLTVAGAVAKPIRTLHKANFHLPCSFCEHSRITVLQELTSTTTLWPEHWQPAGAGLVGERSQSKRSWICFRNQSAPRCCTHHLLCLFDRSEETERIFKTLKCVVAMSADWINWAPL